MSYEKQTWINDVSPLNAERMNHMEEGIAAAALAEDIPSDYVKTVNGIVPDENGDVEFEIPVTSVNGMTGDVVIEIPEVEIPVTSVNGMTGDVVIEAGSGGAASWNDLEDRPFYDTRVYEETVTEISEITWDGNTSGLFCSAGTGGEYYRVSELTPDISLLNSGSPAITFYSTGDLSFTEETVDGVRRYSDYMYAVRDINGDYVIMVCKEGADLPAGTYFWRKVCDNDGVKSYRFPYSVTLNGTHTCTEAVVKDGEVKTIDMQYLPECLQCRAPEILYEYDVNHAYDTVEGMYKVSDVPVEYQSLIGKLLCAYTSSGVQSRGITESTITPITDTYDVYTVQYLIIVVLQDSFDSGDGTALTKGVWINGSMVDSYHRIEVCGDIGKTIDECVIPDSIARVSDIQHYTYGTEDLTAGTSALETGKLYFVYEE